jgi:hypothetical protein
VKYRFVPTLLILAAIALAACGGEKKPAQDPDARQQVNIPRAQAPAGGLQPVEVPADKLPDLSKISAVEAQIFKRTIGLQIPYYDKLVKWADRANKIEKGTEAAASLREYLNIQNEFAAAMQRLDLEFAGKVDPNYAGSKTFEKVVDEYMSDPELIKRTEYIVESYVSLMQRFKTDPACKDFFAEVERLARESQ